MKKNPLFVAVSNQKGGVGKSTMLITLASLLNYSMGKNVAIVDCDSTQRSLFNLRERDMEMVEINKKYMVLLEEQRLRGCRIYPIRQAKPENARQVAGELAAMRVGGEPYSGKTKKRDGHCPVSFFLKRRRKTERLAGA